ncbi:MAG: hypothetical protein SFW07_02225 [Gammaproteobacteria bacterium]|nr:hypothetical protein [Gammaproteobacteria bacterium]
MQQPSKEKKYTTRIVNRVLTCQPEFMLKEFDWNRTTPWASDRVFLEEFQSDPISFLAKFKSLTEAVRLDVIRANFNFIFYDTSEGESAVKTRIYAVKKIIKTVYDCFSSSEVLDRIAKMYLMLGGLTEAKQDLKNVDVRKLERFIQEETDRFLLPCGVGRYEDIPTFLKTFKQKHPEKTRKLLYKLVSGERKFFDTFWNKLLYNLAIDEKSTIDAIGFLLMVITLKRRDELLTAFEIPLPKMNGPKMPAKWANPDKNEQVPFKHCGGHFFIGEFLKGKESGYRSRDCLSFGIQVNPITQSTPKDVNGNYEEHAKYHLDKPARLDGVIPSEYLSEGDKRNLSLALIRTEYAPKIHDYKVTLFQESPITFESHERKNNEAKADVLKQAGVPEIFRKEILKKVL